MPTFIISDAAADKLLDTLNVAQDPPQMLRISIQGGGCAGFEYRFDIEQTPEESDLRFDKQGVTVVIDPISFPYLDGATLDYVAEKFDARFVLRNPHAKTTCGCGQSFAG